MNSRSKHQSGQVVVILLLVVVVALGVGLSVVGRSVTEISTSTKTEDSSRAFSAAEAGIEKALIGTGPSGGGSISPGTLTNNAAADYGWQTNLPPAGTAIEYPPYGKESFALFWLANPDATPPSLYYNQTSFDLYFGTKQIYTDLDDQPAVEVQVVYYTASGYVSSRAFYDSYNPSRSNFGGCTKDPLPIVTNYTGNNNRQFYCKATVVFSPAPAPPGTYPVLVRVRLLYSNDSHPVALQPLSTAPCTPPNLNACSLPPQLKIYTSTGTAGETQRKVQLFQIRNAIPDLFGYALFSAGDLSK